MAKDTDNISFSAREMEVLALAWQCFETEPRINIDKLAELTGYTRGSAGVTMGKIKRKLNLSAKGAAGIANPQSTPKKSEAAKTPKSSRKRSAAEVDTDETPSKRGYKTTKKSTTRGGEDATDDEFADVKIKPEETEALLRGADDYFLSHAADRGFDDHLRPQAQEDF